uniref:RING-type E3 ubiquitin transferase n=1 Tax=Oryza nivara TaxID=4536 RepID=A0A0E0G536_ORYNI
MDMASIECVSYSDSMDDDDDDGVGVGGVSHLPRPILVKPSSAAAAVNVVVVSAGSGGGAGGGGVGVGVVAGAPAVPPATSVHELLECPVCTNSMYPPIHQVRHSWGSCGFFLLLGSPLTARESSSVGWNRVIRCCERAGSSLRVCLGVLDPGASWILPFPATGKHGVLAAFQGIGWLPRRCQNGHTLCSTCKTRVHNRCPTCRQELGDIRCLALEKVAESLELPCKYYSLGCPEIFPYYSKLKHESQCNFRPYNCPYAGSECSVVGDIPFLVAHLRDDHKVDMHSGCTFNHRYVKSNPREVENATWMLTVFHCFGQYFCLHFEAFQLGVAPVYMAFLRFMGDENDARNYSYSLEVGANGRKMIWEGTPRSIRDSHRKVRDSHDGLIIQRNMALFFSGGERKELKLRVTGRIWKEQQNPDSGACIPNLFS